ncbi:MAG: hypothetical protein JWQ44_547 [Chthoniobacter sp.]|jgi:lysophospholipid acyltransferase (LPLAT)-like uncharacterized protein|nr:hypothetical protein [Chthoniobacter sp.]
MTSVQKAKLLAALATWIARPWLATLRFEMIDHAGVLRDPPERPLLWCFWHNRLFVMAHMFEKFFPDRPGAALASASKDGEIIAAVMQRFGIRAIRGSSSRRGAMALVEMKRAIDAGEITALTPDGPRGPRYHVNPGVIKLAQLTGGTALPIHIRYSRCWRLSGWDGFMIPEPFARITVTFLPLHHVAPTDSDAAFEAERARLEAVMRSAADD